MSVILAFGSPRFSNPNKVKRDILALIEEQKYDPAMVHVMGLRDTDASKSGVGSAVKAWKSHTKGEGRLAYLNTNTWHAYFTRNWFPPEDVDAILYIKHVLVYHQAGDSEVLKNKIVNRIKAHNEANAKREPGDPIVGAFEISLRIRLIGAHKRLPAPQRE